MSLHSETQEIQEKRTSDDNTVVETGSCHCGRIRFQVTLPSDFLDSVELVDCNCSICNKKGYVHLIVPKDRFSDLTGSDQDVHAVYTFNTHKAKHYFCKHCGCAPFYIAKSNPNGIDVNVRCMDRGREMIGKMKMIEFDGQNWESSMEKDTKLRHMDL